MRTAVHVGSLIVALSWGAAVVTGSPPAFASDSAASPPTGPPGSATTVQAAPAAPAHAASPAAPAAAAPAAAMPAPVAHAPAAPAGSESPTQGAAPASAASTHSSASTSSTAADEQQICRRVETLGSRIRKGKVCKTKREWDEITRNAKETMRAIDRSASGAGWNQSDGSRTQMGGGGGS